MQYRASQFNDRELQMDSVENNNRDVFSDVLPDVKGENPKPLTNVVPNQKTTFREISSLDDTDGGYVVPKPTFAYGGDNGVETSSPVTK